MSKNALDFEYPLLECSDMLLYCCDMLVSTRDVQVDVCVGH